VNFSRFSPISTSPWTKPHCSLLPTVYTQTQTSFDLLVTHQSCYTTKESTDAIECIVCAHMHVSGGCVDKQWYKPVKAMIGPIGLAYRTCPHQQMRWWKGAGRITPTFFDDVIWHNYVCVRIYMYDIIICICIHTSRILKEPYKGEVEVAKSYTNVTYALKWMDYLMTSSTTGSN
jgi:hypothetical protein